MNKRDFIWNMIGSVIYAVTSMLLGAAVSRILGADAGGIFLFAFSTIGQHMFIVSYFGLRPVQVTDTSVNIVFGDYRRFRLLTCTAAFIIAVIFAALYAGFTLKGEVIVLMCLFKILDGMADCYESEYQRDGRLDLTGKSLTFRTLCVMVCFIAAMLISKDLLISCIVAVIALAIAMMICCELPLKKLKAAKGNCTLTPDYSVNDGSIKKVFDAGKWLFLSAFLDLYVFSACKYAIDATQSAAVSGYFALIFIPTSVINLLANFVIRPVLTELADNFGNGKLSEFRKTIGKISALIAAITIVGMVAAYFLGIPVLGFIAGAETGTALKPYAWALAILILGGGFYAILNLLYYALVIVKKQRVIFFIYIGATALATALCFPLAGRYGINGAAYAYLTCMVLMAAAFAIATAAALKKAEVTNGN